MRTSGHLSRGGGLSGTNPLLYSLKFRRRLWYPSILYPQGLLPLRSIVNRHYTQQHRVPAVVKEEKNKHIQ